MHGIKALICGSITIASLSSVLVFPSPWQAFFQESFKFSLQFNCGASQQFLAGDHPVPPRKSGQREETQWVWTQISGGKDLLGFTKC